MDDYETSSVGDTQRLVRLSKNAAPRTLERLTTKRSKAGNPTGRRSANSNILQWFLFSMILVAILMIWVGTFASIATTRQPQEQVPQVLSSFLSSSIPPTSNGTELLSPQSIPVKIPEGNVSHISSKNNRQYLHRPTFLEQQNLLSLPKQTSPNSIKFYILEVPKWTTDFFEASAHFGSSPDNILHFYDSSLNEYSGEMWLHRGFENMTYEKGRTFDPKEAHVFLIPAYLHYWKRMHLLDFVKNSTHRGKKKQGQELNKKQDQIPNKKTMRRAWYKDGRRKLTEVKEQASDLVKSFFMKSLPDFSKVILQSIQFPDKPHVLLIPTVNPEEARKIQLFQLVTKLKQAKVNLFSVAYERNRFWHNMKPDRLIPIPYVVRLESDHPKKEQVYLDETFNRRVSNFVFYSGNARKMSEAWGGCDRKMITPLRNRTDMHVKLVNQKSRLPQMDYMKFMHETAEYCLILCGDTVSSRSFSSSIVANCIPIRVGSRLRGFCDPPCRKGWGWTITNGLSHLPYGEFIPWDIFPEVNEAEFSADPYQTLVKQVFERYDEHEKKQLRSIMRQIRPGFIYGYGNPASSDKFGGAILYAWQSILYHLNLTATF